MDDLSTLPLATVSDISPLRARISDWRQAGDRIGFVPTMGALHDGHMSLIKLAREKSDRVVVSIFVNPAQFAPGEDFDAYPRTLEADAKKLAETGCDLLFAPTGSVMYPHGYALTVHIGGPSAGLETDFRPHFFDGVATVVAKLFNQVRPDIAVFGEKDYQQLLVVTRLAADLDHAVEIIPAPILREPDGLAMSSRNVYLSKRDRARAAQLSAILASMVKALESGAFVPSAQAEAMRAAHLAFDSVDYIEARCAETLAPLPAGPLDRPARLLAAVKLGATRLIDNMSAKPLA